MVQGTEEVEGEHGVGGSDDWSRRLDRRETVFWYGLAGVTYCGAAIFEKGLLNWFVGPLWLVAVIWFGPWLGDRVRGAWRARPTRRSDPR